MTGLATLGLLAVALGCALTLLARRVPADPARLVAHIDALLPQTQCGQCGYPGCRPYAQAIALGDADIDRCPPGGTETIHALARLLGRDPKPLDPACGTHRPRALARIDEQRCIGCTLCIQACPVDAIIGAPKLMHTVIESHCTGCELCLPPCPVDCIDMTPAGAESAPWTWHRPTVVSLPAQARP